MKGKRHIPLFGFITVLFFISLYSYVPTLSPYSKSLGASYKMVGVIVGSYGFAQLLIRVPLGIFSDRLNRRKPFIIAGLGMAFLSAVGLYLFQDLHLILTFRALSGVAAATYVTFTVLFSSYFKEDEAVKAIGYINSFGWTGQMIAMIMGGLAAEGYGQQAPFLVAAVGAFLAFVLSPGLKEKKIIDEKKIQLSSLSSIIFNKNLLLVSLMAVILQLVGFATIFGFVPVVATELGASSYQLGIMTTLATLPGIIAAFLSGSYFVVRYGEKKVVSFGFFLLALSCIIVPLIGNLFLLYVSQIIAGFGRGLNFSVLMGMSIRSIDEKRRATAMGFYQAVYSLGMITGPVLLGLFSDTFNLKIGFWIIGAIGLSGVLINNVFAKERTELVRETLNT